MNLSKKILSIIPVLILFWGCTNFTDGLEKNSTQNNSDIITVNCSIGVNGAVPNVIIDALKNNPGSERTACPSIDASEIGYLIEKTCGNEKETYDSRADENRTSIKGYYLDGSNETEFTSSDNKLLSGFSIGLEIGKSYSIVVKVYKKEGGSTDPKTILLESNVVNTGVVNEATVISEPFILKPVAASAGATGTINLPIDCDTSIVTKLTVLYNGQEKGYTENLDSLTFTGNDFFSNTNPIPAGSYDFIFRFYGGDENSGHHYQLLCEVQQTIPVYPNLCTNTWVNSDNDEYFTEDASETVKLNITEELAKSKKRTIYYIDSNFQKDNDNGANYTQQIGNAEQPFVSLTELKNKVEFDSDKKYNIYIKAKNDGIYEETLNEWVELDFPCTIETYEDFPGDKKGRAVFTAAQDIQTPNISVGVIHVTSDCDIYNVTVQAENETIDDSSISGLLTVEKSGDSKPTVNLYNCEFKNANKTGLYLEGSSSYRVNCNLYGCKISNINFQSTVIFGGGINCVYANLVIDSYDGKETGIWGCTSTVGGIYLNESQFIMKSGYIKGCKGSQDAGGIKITGNSYCTIYGGTIGGTSDDDININTNSLSGADIIINNGAKLYFYGGACLSPCSDGTIFVAASSSPAEVHIKGSAYIGDESVIFLGKSSNNLANIILDGPLTHSGCVAKVNAIDGFNVGNSVLKDKDGKDCVKDYFSKFTIVNSADTSWGLNKSGMIVKTVGGLSESPKSGEYYITCPQDYAKLLKFGNIPSGVKYILASDIDISEVQSGSQFSISGTFDGDNNSITGVNAAIVSTVESGGILKNLTLYGSSKTAGFANTNKGTVENCINNVDVNFNSTTDAYIAGIVQINEGGTIKKCVNNKTINGYNDNSSIALNCGGIAGICRGDNCVIDRCINYGYLHSRQSIRNKGGGIVASVEGPTIIKNCANFSQIANFNDAGGIVGYTNSRCTIQNCYHYYKDNIVCYFGGEIAGKKGVSNNAEYVIANCYANKNKVQQYQVSFCKDGYSSGGGVNALFTDTDLTSQETVDDLNSWVYSQTGGDYCRWKLDTEKGYPVFDE